MLLGRDQPVAQTLCRVAPLRGHRGQSRDLEEAQRGRGAVKKTERKSSTTHYFFISN